MAAKGRDSRAMDGVRVIKREVAETIALQVLGWLAADETLWAAFMAASGASPAEAPARAADPEFLGAVLDFVLMDDGWVTGASAALSLPPDRLLTARAALPGGEAPHWT